MLSGGATPMNKRLYPEGISTEALELTLSVCVDGVPLSSALIYQDRIDLYESWEPGTWETLDFSFTVVPAGPLPQLVGACVSVYSSTTKLRNSVSLAEAEGTFRGSMSLSQGNVWGHVVIKARGFSDSNEFLADSQAVVLRPFAPQEPNIEGLIRTEWVSFSHLPDLIEGSASGAQHYVDYSGDLPVVRLNSDDADFRRVLDPGQLASSQMRIAQELASQAVAQSARLSMVIAAIQAIEVDADSDEPYLKEQSWEEAILREALAKMYPGLPYERTLHTVRDAWGDVHRARDVIGRLQLAVESVVGAQKSTKAAAREFDDDSAE